ncbi:tetratricopeptide repeat protein [Sphingomicrobium lutaoense]|uniref:TolA-binding protein n=1 Tax=Sphingomicrobium lutaoense TaxID=515949 RepID=A0A839YZN2_9SPHN|nr:tetratricopeptide repeat protein [Sphingomicrobium lutaoense]MBB3764456.1 TolA-binding protein [Sphingomicrobium lutaoense]
MRLPILTAFLVTTSLIAVPAHAQDDRKRERENRERIERLEKQVRQVQKQVFPDGRPADTAGFYDDPVASRSSVDVLTGRVDTLERQMTELIRNSEEAQYRLGQMEAELARLRAAQEAASRRSVVVEDETRPAVSTPRYENRPEPAEEEEAAPPPPAPRAAQANTTVKPVPANDPSFEAAGEEAYTQGYRLWNSGNNDEAITVLRAMESSFPGHRRVSWARNLIGRALLDKGEPRAAAEALLANYRSDPDGERAADSLYFLGQALMRLNQPGQACKAYEELNDVYGANMRDYLRERLPAAMRDAKCG